MRYIKRFNENKELEELQELVSTQLSYLLDDSSFRIEIEEKKRSNNEPYYIILIYKLISVARDIIQWNNIKSDIITFLYTLSSEYNLIEFGKTDNTDYVYNDNGKYNIEFNRYLGYRSYSEKSSDYYIMSVDDVISDDKSIPENFYHIKIVVEK